jgi:hypothetical protein
LRTKRLDRFGPLSDDVASPSEGHTVAMLVVLMTGNEKNKSVEVACNGIVIISDFTKIHQLVRKWLEVIDTRHIRGEVDSKRLSFLMEKKSKVKSILQVEGTYFVLSKLNIISYNRRKGFASDELHVQSLAQSCDKQKKKRVMNGLNPCAEEVLDLFHFLLQFR